MTRHDVVQLLTEFGLVRKFDNQRRIVVQLGKYGDILNILPAIRLMSQQCGQPVNLMVAEKFADLVQGLSYVRPVIFHGDFFHGLNEAIALCKANYDDVVVTQVCGTDWNYQRVEKHFNMESWRMSGMGQHFHTGKLVLDNRDFAAEKHWAGKFLSSSAPNVLVNLTGTSSPFLAGPTLLQCLRTALPSVNFVDLSGITAGSLQCLLGLYDRSVCLITCDTATLHLARSHPIPVIAFCAEGWNGCNPVANVAFRCTYKQVWQHLDTVMQIVKRCADSGEAHPKLLHLWQDYESRNEATKAREVTALESWKTNSEAVLLQFKPENYPNALDVGDTVNAPDLKAVLDKAVFDHPNSIVMLSNNDICVMPGADVVVREAVNRHGCFYSHRIDVETVTLPLDPELAKGEQYPGADLFAFTLDWWKQWRDLVPNLYMSFEGWDFVMKALMLQSGFKKTEPVIVHQMHETSNWKFQNERPAQKHNRAVCRKWAMDNSYAHMLLPEGSDFIFKAL